MCGIAGIFQPEGLDHAQQERCLEVCLQRMAHRGPDAQGVWFQPTPGVALGHARLSIIDTTSAANQPMGSSRTGAVIVFNGEIYNYLELRSELESRGISFQTHSDTEVLLAAYDTWGWALLSRLVGMFAFAIWDPQKHSLFLGRDRAGEKPLYFFCTPQRFGFASELPALELLGGPSREIDRRAISSYLHMQYIPSPMTAWQGYYKLPPATGMVVPLNLAHRQWRYWDPTSVRMPVHPIREPEALEQLDALMKQSVKGQMLSDVPLGAFLSGGIDSSVVVATMASLATKPVETFTVGFYDPSHDEAPFAASVARHLGTNHHVEYMTEQDLLDQVERLPQRFGEPFGDSSALPTYLVSKAARKVVTVSLSGDGGDELFGGYSTYASLERYLQAHRLFGPALKNMPQGISQRIPKLARLCATNGLPIGEIFRSLVGAFTPEEAQAFTGQSPSTPLFDSVWRLPNPSDARRMARMADMLSYLPDDILVKVDRSAMAVSLESRAPLLDHRIIEFALTLPPALVTGKRLLKKLAYRSIPKALLDRPKRGFSIPLATWFRGRLKPLLLDHLRPESLERAGIDHPDHVQRLVDAHMQGHNHAMRLWILLMLVMWNER